MAEFDKENNITIGKSMAAPRDLTKLREAFQSVLPNVQRMKSFKEFADVLGPFMAKAVVSLHQESVAARVPAATCVARLLDVSLHLDHDKMHCPAVQNDFSFYRRSLAKLTDVDAPVRDRAADDLSMFLASQTPVLDVVDRSIASAGDDAKKAAVAVFVDIAHACCAMLMQQRDGGIDPAMCGRAMVGCLVVADRLRVGGVFASSAKVQVGKCIKQLQTLDELGTALCATLLYSTKTGRENSIPPRIQRQLRQRLGK
mmetsp:Transcript_26946/g.86637  ORF Transcript_26946/g.86637 Transcript_26946/m.86637 type:complete len:257 (+) Transcript_26946:3-773(+)